MIIIRIKFRLPLTVEVVPAICFNGKRFFRRKSGEQSRKRSRYCIALKYLFLRFSIFGDSVDKLSNIATVSLANVHDIFLGDSS